MYADRIYRIATIADIHFGCPESAEYMYTQLKDQFINKLARTEFDIVGVLGDLFHSKYLASNPAITYACQFMDDLVNLCLSKNADLIIISGTQSHDANQLSLFYHYMQYPNIRIIENIEFVDSKGLRILCIPELYGLAENEYKKAFYHSGRYDLCFLHGTYKNSFKGSEIATLKSNHTPVFGINYFENCAGPILMGHYHIPSVYDSYAYYNGSAFRFQFGEEQEKGFLMTLYNPLYRTHYTELIPIQSHTYSTINIDHLINEPPDKIISWIKTEKANRGIDYIRIQFNVGNDNMNIVRNYFRNSGTVKLQEVGAQERQMAEIDKEIVEQNSQWSYIIDKNMSDYEKFVRYVNDNEGCEFITVEELIKILEDNK